MMRHVNIPLLPATNHSGAPEYIVAALDRRWRRFLIELRKNRRRRTERGIHDLRVSIRRLIAVLDLAVLIVPDAVRPRLRKSMAAALRSFSPLRDLHIQILGLASLRRQFPVVVLLVVALRVRERMLVREAGQAIARVNVEAVGRDITRVQTEILSASGDAAFAAAMNAILVGAAARRFLRVHERYRRLTASDLRSIHRMRVAFKRFRYTIEALQPLLPGVTRERLKEMNAFQDLMGAIQDTEVVTAAVERGRPAAARGGSTLLLRQHLALRRRELVEAFLPEARKFLVFWPSPSGEPVAHRKRVQSHESLHYSSRHRR
jgi:CHAD domain-containing protein